ncbi:MAG: cupredoxin domain-containing protein [Thaumarchaeota archaeon]|nr:cupredoxin domain-containing protein [Nitrososphaerota archaeon]
MNFSRKGKALSSATASVLLVVMLSFTAIAYLSFFLGQQGSTIQTLQARLDTLQNQVKGQNTTVAKLNSLQTEIVSLNSTLGKYAVDQPPIVRDVTLTWTKDLSLQDRFFGGPIVVNQGDTIHVTFISNDTVAHTFTLGPPYDFQINASLPGLVNDLTLKNFTGPATNNSQGVIVSGSSGHVSAMGSFIAKYVGIYDYVCIYHVNVGMFGFLIVLPNVAYSGTTTHTVTTTNVPQSPMLSRITILKGAGTDPTSLGYSPASITVVIGVNNTVVWTNKDAIFHTVTATDGGFNSGTIFANQNYSHTFSKLGTYSYYFCEYHPWMRGTVIVKGG